MVGMANNVLTKATASIDDISLIRLDTKKLHYHTYNGVLESGQSALTALLEMCDSFRTWPVWYDGRFNFVVDKDDTPVHVLAKSNTESFSQSFIPLSEIPYLLIGQYTDESNKYEMTSLLAKSTSTTLTKINEKTIGLKGITNRKKAERELKWKLNKVTNCTHTVNIKAGLDAIHATAGDIITVQDDLPQWGYGGRVLSYNSTNANIILSNSITVASVSATNIIKYQGADNNFVVATLDTSGLSNGDSTASVTVQGWPDSTYPKTDAVFVVGKSGSYSKKFRIVTINRSTEDSVELSALEHLSSLYSSEPTITVVEDRVSQLPNPLARPLPPTDTSVKILPNEEGVGFILNAKPANDGSGVTEIITKIKKSAESADSFEIAAIIPASVGYAKYINDNLELGEEYTISFESKNATKTSAPIYVTITLERDYYILSTPTGIRLQNYDQNSQTFKGRDITIEWNPVSGAFDYVIEVYHTSIVSGNILRTAFVRSESYTYNYENMIDDSGGVIRGISSSKIIFRLSARHITGIESAYSLPFEVYNLVPPAISGLKGSNLVGGVQFSWNKSNEQDHRSYLYSYKVGSTGSWVTTASLADNTFSRTLTATDITAHGNKTNISFKVKDKDWFNQVSATFVITTASANRISDSLFQVFITKSGGTGTNASIYDGDFDSGGIIIA
jgi:hypothetical protein